MSTTFTDKSLHPSSKVLGVVYGGIAVAALVATWTQNTAYLHAGIGRFFTDFLAGVEVTPASRSIACDILYFFLAAAIFMVIEARKHGIRFVWAYILAGMFIDISVAFPLFLIARELQIGAADAPRPRPVDTILLAVLAVGVAALTIWIDTR
jgi:Terpene cyclase DEP1